MVFVILAALALLLILGPGIWTRWVLKKHATPREDYPGTGGELARHLLDRFGLESVVVEATDRGDHYDPIDKAVRLSGIGEGNLVKVPTMSGHAMDPDRLAAYEPSAARKWMDDAAR